MELNPYYGFRDKLADLLERDLVGPGPTDPLRDDEVLLVDPPITRYVSGILFPQSEDSVDPDQDLDESDDDETSEQADPPVAMANVKFPSSMAVTFAVSSDCREVEVAVTAAQYLPEDVDASDDDVEEGTRRRGRRHGGATARLWRRIQFEPASVTIDVSKAVADGREALLPGLSLFWRARPEREGTVSVTLGLINTNQLPVSSRERDEHSFFQPTLSVVGIGQQAPFVSRHQDEAHGDDDDLRSYQLLYRHTYEFASGHGCSADWSTSPNHPGRASEIHIEHVPRYELLIADSNSGIESDWFEMTRLAESPRGEVLAGLGEFCNDYGRWIDSRAAEAAELEGELRETADKHLEYCTDSLRRMREGLDLLERDNDAWRAFTLANLAMAEQRARSDQILSGTGSALEHDLSGHAWRPFQLGFILQALVGLADPHHEDRTLVDLLWFPTGGGKTEAYLGLIAFITFLRRLRSPGSGGGATVLMRYTLRLLTIQQFERATLLVCVCEKIRRSDPDRLGREQISIGLWIGRDGTPNSLRETRKALDSLRGGSALEKGNPVQLNRCPWCGIALDHRNYWISDHDPKLMITCRNNDCMFEKGLPVYLVDEDVYRFRPTLLIATADKFAGLPWQERTTALFNIGHPEAPPEMIIQDELHLISGPLGTLAGLYETAVDDLCRDDDGCLPKVIASTATIRRAQSQVNGLFARDVRQFPPPALDARDSWFAVERSRDERGTRLYLGLLAPATSQTTLLVRTYAVLLENAAELPGEDVHRDPYWTLLGYFNSLRILGGARMQVQDDVPGYMAVVAGRDGKVERAIDRTIELTSREATSSIPIHLKEMERTYGEGDALDVILATNMISVGVDVSRLGLMAVMGQPQSASEYIQATSRVGRRYPGLVTVIFNAARSRDRSHYEGFVAFHQALYRQVDSSSVTPFSPRARDRGLHAVLVALARLMIPALRANRSAGDVSALTSELPGIRDLILKRIRVIAPQEEAASSVHLDELIANWIRRAESEPGLCYSDSNDPESGLLAEANDPDLDGDQFATLRSLRDVDTESAFKLVRN